MRVINFDEVCLGYNKEEVMVEVNRCLVCKKLKCVGGCLVGIDILGFIIKIKEDDIEGVVKVIVKSSLLLVVCGRVCL